MKYPKALKENGIIGFVAPSFGCSIDPYRSRFDSSLKKWKEKGYKTHLGPNCYADDGIGISSSPDKCGEELTTEYCSDLSDVLISCGGGELMCESMSFVDFEKIARSNPKWFLGYSDNTNFTFTLTTICDVASIYGPCAASFGARNWHKSLEDAKAILTGNALEDAYSVTHFSFSGYGMWEDDRHIGDEACDEEGEEDYLKGFEPNTTTDLHLYIGDGEKLPIGDPFSKEVSELKMTGRLIGGCLDCLVNLCGTRFDHTRQFTDKYNADGIIWYLEACDLNPMGNRRAVWELEEAGWFKNASGFIIGRPLHLGEEMMGLDNYKAVYDILSHHKVPILMDADIGHLGPSVPIINGAYAEVSAKDDDWTIDMYLK